MLGLRHQASRMRLLQLKVLGMPAITVLQALLTVPLPAKVVEQQNPLNLLNPKTPTSPTLTTSPSKLRRKWQLLAFWNLEQPMKGQSKTRNGRMPKS